MLAPGIIHRIPPLFLIHVCTPPCPPHSFGYFGINASKTKTSIEDNHAASAFINHGKKLNVEAVVQLFGLLSVPVKAGRFGPTTHANSLVQLSFRREALQNGF